MKLISDNSVIKQFSKEPQMNADERRFINSKTVRFTGTHSETKFNKSSQRMRSTQSMVAKPFSLLLRNVQIPQNRTQMTWIGRIFTDNSNPCLSASSVLSVFHSKIVNRIYESNSIHNGYSEKWGEIYL